MFKRQKIGATCPISQRSVRSAFIRGAKASEWSGLLPEETIAATMMTDLATGKVEYYDIGGYRYVYE